MSREDEFRKQNFSVIASKNRKNIYNFDYFSSSNFSNRSIKSIKDHKSNSNSNMEINSKTIREKDTIDSNEINSNNSLKEVNCIDKNRNLVRDINKNSINNLSKIEESVLISLKSDDYSFKMDKISIDMTFKSDHSSDDNQSEFKSGSNLIFFLF